MHIALSIPQPHIEVRLAQMSDVPQLQALIPESARKLQRGLYSEPQLDGAIGTVFGVDTQLIKDGTYFVAVAGCKIVGCGGWSKRKTQYGGDAAKKREDQLRDPSKEPAMIRAFFVHPDYVRKGIGREFLRLSEEAAFAAGFRDIEIVATLAGERLYASCGYFSIERHDIKLVNGELMPVVRMKRAARHSSQA
jgi:GNAT superfamily N-acetyltransferase